MNVDRASVVPGDHDFLILGSRSGGGLAAALATVESGDAKLSDTVAIGKGQLDDPQGVDLGDGRWVVAGVGCVSPSDTGCKESFVFTYLVDFDGSPEEIAQIPVDQEGFKLLGVLSDGRVPVELGSNVLPATVTPENTRTTYKSRFLVLDPKARSVRPIEWTPPDMNYDALTTSSPGVPAPSRPDRQVCAVGSAILMLETADQAGARVVSLTTIRPDDPQKSSSPELLSVDPEEVPQLLCDSSTAGPLIMTASRSTNTVKVRTVGPDGKLSAGEGFTWTDEVLAEKHAGGSVAITTGGIKMPTDAAPLDGSVPKQPDRQVVVYRGGQWLEGPSNIQFGQQAFVSGDGKSLLIRQQGSGENPTSFTGVEL
jgi:hypothetical protein